MIRFKTFFRFSKDAFSQGEDANKGERTQAERLLRKVLVSLQGHAATPEYSGGDDRITFWKEGDVEITLQWNYRWEENGESSGYWVWDVWKEGRHILEYSTDEDIMRKRA